MQSRRGFFSSLVSLAQGKKGEEEFFPYLPGFISEKMDHCRVCETSACQNVCEEGIVFRSENGLPKLDFSKRGCTFCGECAHSCESDCFAAEPVKKLDALAEIGILACLAWNNVICRSCGDVCNDKAISFTGMFNPQINPSLCTGCGFCIGVCPGYAIEIRPKGNG